MTINWQYTIAALLLAAAVFYVIRSIFKGAASGNHDCPDCGVSAAKPAKKKQQVPN
ncbi:MAG: FeoB-associated Cys-rich membrane protein [Bacteroidota bacterium]|nr:FeoB-associated Cys-rich membrane protein [Bacteroidota bacterium]